MSGEDSEQSDGSGKRSSSIASILGRFRSQGRSPDRKWSVMGRRGVLKSLAAIGLSGPAMDELAQKAQAATDDPTSEVPYVAAYEAADKDALQRGEPVEMEEVVRTMSRERWVRIKASSKASRGLYRSIHARFDAPFVSTGVRTGSDGRKEVVVTRRLPENVDESSLPTAFDDLRDWLPATVSGTVGTGKEARTRSDIPVRAEEWSLRPHYADGEYRPVPGGCKMQADNSVGTFAQPVYNENNSSMEMLSAGHVMEGDNGEVWQPESNCGWVSCDPTIGSVTQAQNNYNDTSIDVDDDGDGDNVILTNVDAGTCSLNSDTSYKYALADDSGGYRKDIVSFWTWTQIEDAEDTTTDVPFQGHTSGIIDGNVIHTDSANGWFVTDATSQDGDSGGPFYHDKNSSEVSTVGVVSAGVDIDGDGNADDGTSGNSMGQIFDELGLRFTIGI